ncbi:peptidylprolyl isomerase [Marinifilum sp.]|uniref:peptidylprolyl isomerase n=1 Tax=Marinifilum sp. TaxID=2033137 RepID=UPI003BACD4AF
MKKLIHLLTLSVFNILACNSQNPIVVITTDFGDIELEIFSDKAPATANHFMQNIDKGIFKDASFYRVVRKDNQPNNDVKIEVIQGGLFHDSIVDNMPRIRHETTIETGILHKNGVISMARMEPGSASTEIFICIGNQPELDFGGKRNPDGQGFAAFGIVTNGMNVVKKIQQQKDKDQMLIEHIKIINIKQK